MQLHYVSLGFLTTLHPIRVWLLPSFSCICSRVDDWISVHLFIHTRYFCFIFLNWNQIVIRSFILLPIRFKSPSDNLGLWIFRDIWNPGSLLYIEKRLFRNFLILNIWQCPLRIIAGLLKRTNKLPTKTI